MSRIFSPFALSQYFKLLALIAIYALNKITPNWVVATMSVAVIGTFIASEAFILMLTRSLMKEPTDENIVKLFIAILFRDSEQAEHILEDYRKEKEEKYLIERAKNGLAV